jgi:hypothetical protein
MPNIYNSGQLATIIQNLAQNEMGDLGATDALQKSAIYSLMNIAMMKLARIAYNTTYSDALAISTDGFVTFQVSSQAITNMFEPLVVLTSADQEIQKRTSYSAPTGWWRDSQNLEIHVRGLTVGNYTLKYIRYPKLVTLDTDTVEFPPSGYDALIKDIMSLVKLTRNSYAGSEYMDGKSKAALGEVTQAAMSAKGTGSTGQPVGTVDLQIARGG